MTSILRKLMTAIARVGGGRLVLGGTMALAGGSATPSASIASVVVERVGIVHAERLRVG